MLPALQKLDPYCQDVDGETGLLFSNADQLLTMLERLHNALQLRQQVAAAAHGQLIRKRCLEQHDPWQLDPSDADAPTFLDCCLQTDGQRLLAPAALERAIALD